MRSAKMSVAGVACVVLRVSFTGDLGWEVHCEESDQVQLYSALLEAAAAYNAGPVGSRALMSLRVEKGYGSWGRDYSPEWWPQESGLAGLIKTDKEFLNKEAYLEIAENAPRETLELFEVEVEDADATGGEPIFLPDGTAIGQVSSGAYGYSVGKSLALGYVKFGAVEPGGEVSIAVLGQPHKARMLSEPPFDPDGLILRDKPQ